MLAVFRLHNDQRIVPRIDQPGSGHVRYFPYYFLIYMLAGVGWLITVGRRKPGYSPTSRPTWRRPWTATSIPPRTTARPTRRWAR